MQIVILSKTEVEHLPPILTAIDCLRAAGAEVVLVSSTVSERCAARLAAKGVRVVNAGGSAFASPFAGRVGRWLAFRRAVRWQIERTEARAIFWVAGGNTGVAVCDLIQGHTYVVHLLESYDEHPHYRWWLRRFIQSARLIIVPSHERAGLARLFFSLKRSPMCIPNCPLTLPLEAQVPRHISEMRMQIAEAAKGRRILLYQGHIEHSERDLSAVLAAADTDRAVWHVVLMGRDYGAVRLYSSLYPGLTYLPHIAAPDHLHITRVADAGLLGYSYGSLNNVFCAPNKVWEYGACGLPFISSDQPHLVQLCSAYDCGVTCDFDDAADTLTALRTVMRLHERLAAGARRLYHSVDLHYLYGTVLEKLYQAHGCTDSGGTGQSDDSVVHSPASLQDH